jgi:hypothetical protein
VRASEGRADNLLQNSSVWLATMDFAVTDKDVPRVHRGFSTWSSTQKYFFSLLLLSRDLSRILVTLAEVHNIKKWRWMG